MPERFPSSFRALLGEAESPDAVAYQALPQGVSLFFCEFCFEHLSSCLQTVP